MLIGKPFRCVNSGGPNVCRCGRSGKVWLDLSFKEIPKLTPQNNHTLNINTANNTEAFYFTIKTEHIKQNSHPVIPVPFTALSMAPLLLCLPCLCALFCCFSAPGRCLSCADSTPILCTYFPTFITHT